MEGKPAFYRRRRRRDNELGQVLLRKGVIRAEDLRRALKIQEEQGGHVGAILRRLGACDSKAISEALIEQLNTARAKGKTRNMARRAREDSIGWLSVETLPGVVRGILSLSDAITLSLGAGIVAVASHFAPTVTPQHLAILGVVPLAMLASLALRLYAVTPPSPPDEIRNGVAAVSLAYLACWFVATLSPIDRPGTSVTHWAWLLGWAVSVLIVPVLRSVLRSKLCGMRWWGQPVVVFGAGRVGRAVVKMLQARPQLGLKPVAILDDDPARQGTVRAAWGESDIVIEPVSNLDEESEGTPSERSALEQFSEVEGVPIVGGLELAPALAQRLRVRTAVLAMPEMDAPELLGIIERFADAYTNVLVIPDLFNLTHFGAPTRYLGGALGIEVQRQLLLRGPRAAKRAMDIVLTSVGLLLILPLLFLIAILIKFDSKGGVFFRQRRLGQDGVRFGALKFRTMFLDADRRLAEILRDDPERRAEYEAFHKLTNDPRVTRVGRFLRKYSLDELPQLWNVLVGEMSLVGPRPYLEAEIPDMNQKEAIILRVKPGITGIWQVTWRNESTFEQRVQLDVEYVRNWSPWFDIYVLARTVPVVLGGTGS
jgi:lipopolysaccharide/colanic/teichoic acid biosynthesis glycosyltransferase